MVSRWLFILVALAGRAQAVCDPTATATTTPRASLQRPATKQCDWHVPLQSTIDSLDARAGFLDITSTWSNKQTFGGGLAGETRRLGGIFFDFGAISLTTADVWTFRLDPVAATITRIDCEAYSGTSFTMKVCAGEDPSCATPIVASLVCDTTGPTATTISNATVTARQKVTIVISAVAGTVTKGEIYIQGTTT
jgi:hypothetical protein